MLTTIVGHAGYTNHAVNRDGTAALCRESLKPRMWPVYGNDGLHSHDAVSIHELPGDELGRAADVHRVDCQSCLRKLAKITAEAFDAASAYDTKRSAELDNHVDSRIFNVAEAFDAAIMENATHAPEPTAEQIVRALNGALTATVEKLNQPAVLHMRRSDSNLVFRVLGSEGTGRWTGLYMVAVDDEAYDIFRYIHELDGDGWTACDVNGNVQTAESPFLIGSHVAAHLSPERVYQVDSVEVGAYDGRTRVYLVHPDGERLAFQPSVLAKMYAPVWVTDVKLYDERQREVMHVLGQIGDSLVFRYENDQESDPSFRTVSFAELTAGSRYAAVCEHGYPEQGSRCSRCNPFPPVEHLIGQKVTLKRMDGPSTETGIVQGFKDVGLFDLVAAILCNGARVRVTREFALGTAPIDAPVVTPRAHTLDDSIAEIARVGAAYPDGITYVGDRQA
jgi:hypothetical protein